MQDGLFGERIDGAGDGQEDLFGGVSDGSADARGGQGHGARSMVNMKAPLAVRMRPQTLDEVLPGLQDRTEPLLLEVVVAPDASFAP